MVSLLSGENDIAQPTGFLCKQVENNGKVCPTFPPSRCTSRRRTIPDLALSLRTAAQVIRDSDMFTTTLVYNGAQAAGN